MTGVNAHLGELEHGELPGVAQVEGADVLAVHESHQAGHLQDVSMTSARPIGKKRLLGRLVPEGMTTASEPWRHERNERVSNGDIREAASC